jgi:hypothetical protein
MTAVVFGDISVVLVFENVSTEIIIMDYVILFFEITLFHVFTYTVDSMLERDTIL